MNPILAMTIPFIAGWLLDLLLGDPVWLPHPARLIESFAENLVSVSRGAFPSSPKGEQAAGNLLALLVPLVSLLVAALLLACARLIHPALWMALETLFCYQLMGARRLRDESMRVCGILESKDEQGDLSRARLALSRVTAKDTGSLNRQEITRAAVEAIAGNTAETVVAPMFFLALGGGAFGVFYKSITLLKSKTGWPDAKNRYFGAASARLGDICGFVPSRLAAALMIISSWLTGYDYKNAARVFKSDRFDHINPTSAQTESVCAGALGVSLGGGAFYDGVYNPSPDIGGGGRPPEPGDIRAANRLMMATSFVSAVLLVLIKICLLYILL